MGLKPAFTSESVKRMIAKRVEIIERRVIKILQNLGEKCVIEMRTNKLYENQSSNLVNSTGYMITRDGKMLDLVGFDSSEGGVAGKAFATALAGKHKKGFALYVVAGMEYAEYVEAMNLNVISSAESLVERQLPMMLERLSKNIAQL